MANAVAGRSLPYGHSWLASEQQHSLTAHFGELEKLSITRTGRHQNNRVLTTYPVDPWNEYSGAEQLPKEHSDGTN